MYELYHLRLIIDRTAQLCQRQKKNSFLNNDSLKRKKNLRLNGPLQ